MASHLKRLRKHHEEGEEWAVSFADMMTLLMCFFILMVSISAVDVGRYKQVAESLGIAMKTTPKGMTRPEPAALTDQPVSEAEQNKTQTEVRQHVVAPSAVAPSLPEAPSSAASPVPSSMTAPGVSPEALVVAAPVDTQPTEAAKPLQQSVVGDVASPAQQPLTEPPVKPVAEQVQPALSGGLLGGPSLDAVMGGLEERMRDAGSAVQVERRTKSIAVRLHGPVFFDLASAEIKEASMPFLQRVAEEVRNTRYRLTVEGHTDDLPITSDKFPSNWELSSARAAAVARYMIEDGIDPSRVEVRGFAHVRPLVPNLDEHGAPIPENRVLNRRVVIVVSAPESISEGL